MTPQELAEACLRQAARDGYDVALRPDTPVIPGEHVSDLTERTTWAHIDDLVGHLGDLGCAWVNLRFSLDSGGTTVRYEAKPNGEPLPDGRRPACNGGFDPPA